MLSISYTISNDMFPRLSHEFAYVTSRRWTGVRIGNSILSIHFFIAKPSTDRIYFGYRMPKLRICLTGSTTDFIFKCSLRKKVKTARDIIWNNHQKNIITYTHAHYILYETRFSLKISLEKMAIIENLVIKTLLNYIRSF